jgi:hypothetical protein
VKLVIALNSNGDSVSVYADSEYIGMVFRLTGGFGAAYTPPGCRLGCLSKTGCKANGPCKNKDKAHFHAHSDPADKSADEAIKWLLSKVTGVGEGYQIVWPDGFTTGTYKFKTYTPTTKMQWGNQPNMWDDVPAKPKKKAPQAQPAPIPVKEATLEEQLEEAMSEAKSAFNVD